MKNLINKSLLKKLTYIGLIIAVIAFFAIPSFIFADEEGTTATEIVQTAVTQDTTVDTSADTGETTIVDATVEQPVTTEVETTTDQTVTTDTTVITETDTTEIPETETVTTEQVATETLESTETQNNESTEVVNTEAAYSPAISTDKADYNPGETVTIFGSGFVAGETVEVSFVNADGATEHSGTVVADDSGSFLYSYAIIGSIEYKATARSIINNISATVKFLDSAYAQFIAAGPSLAGSQFYEERMDMNVVLNDGSGTNVPMYAFCIDLQHYLDTGGLWDVIKFEDFNESSKDATLVAWPLPANVYALARSIDPGWLNSDDIGGFTKAQKAAAVQEAFWTLISTANNTDGNNFNYINNGIPAIRDLVTALIAIANTPQAQVSSLTITPTSDVNYLQDNITLNKHELNITATDYLGNAIMGVPVNVTVTGNGFFDALNKTTKSIIAISGTTISLYADKSDYAGINSGTDYISGYVDVNGDQTYKSSSLPGNVSTDLIGSILWPNNRPFPQSASLPWGSNQMLILTGLYEPQAQATKEWRIPGEITVHKSDAVDNTSLAGAIIGLLDGNGNQAKDAWGNPFADQETDINGDIPGFEGLAWGNYQLIENFAPEGYIEVVGPIAVDAINATNLTSSVNIANSRIITPKPTPDPTPDPTPTPTPTPGGGDGGITTLAVAGLTEGTIQVLAFTGMDPIIPIAGIGTVLIGFILFMVSLKKRVTWEHAANK